MKKHLNLILVALVLLGATIAKGQCNDQLVDAALGNLQKFTYLKDFRVKLKKSKKNSPQEARYTVVLSKGTKYRFTCTNAKEYDGKLIFHLYDDSGLVLSSYSKANDKAYNVVDMTCKKTGRYYLSYSFTNGQEGCGVGILAFENKTTSIEDLLKYE